MLTNQAVIEDIKQKFGDAIADVHEPYELLTFTTTRENIVALLEYLRDHQEFQYIFLTTMCGVHFPDRKGEELSVVYQLHSLVHNHRLRIKIFFPIEDAVVPTITGLWPAANWMEREAYDFFGIVFSGHPNLIRVLNMEDMDYFPLRKEYPVEDPMRRDKEDAMFGR
ncbi:NADH-quinone oxidoreductase subunit C [Flexibacter flexilis DSM 6793]|uniref:NADH-quinone oxidoreductase subunit C n=1 Tax=Flexibacter flexilis DSM 6793 TaxID=927664 RepID=A0A1I1DGI4_9BACT|nr:NADH-quinone oxidoreductase subunit C [Flexibacter flexilis]SFB73957.1 NADH-quinone oxidoreductase subunit C [Flexibacter flexilis DSM 6793]